MQTLLLFRNKSTKLIAILNYKFFLKSSKTLVTKSQFYTKNKILLRGSNTPLMYVRAPKHFKAGKQFSFFFNSNFRKKIIIPQNYKINIIKSAPNTLYNFVALSSNVSQPELIISRVTFITKLYLIFFGWCYLFSINNKCYNFFFRFLAFNFYSKIHILK